jgi:dipeptidyl aminopeptidase/acylaminoacyl peptidase
MTMRRFVILSALAMINLVWAEEPADEETAESEVSEEQEAPGELTFDDLFRQASIRQIELSTNGEFIAFFRNNMLVMGRRGEEYQDVRDFHSRLSIRDLNWIGPNTVWVESWDPRSDRRIKTAVRFEDQGEEGFGVGRVKDHYDPGLVNDALIDDDEHVILASPEFDDDTLTAQLYKVDVFEDLEPQMRKSNRIHTGSEEFFYYEKNSSGDYTVGARIANGVPEMWRKAPGSDEWELIWQAEGESEFEPWQLSDDAQTLWVLTDVLTGRMAAAAFDLDSRQFGDILYQHDRFDVESILFSPDTREPIGVTFTEQGLVRYFFFGEQQAADYERLRGLFPGQGILLIGRSADARVDLVFSASMTERGSIHVCDDDAEDCELVAKVAPWLDGKPLSETLALDVVTTDDLVVEAFLTLPANGGETLPLLALPHGGPIGISDDRYFSSEVQWLAHNGYAVLQVNYRGSRGYGEEFKNAGLRQWGRGIEDDIEAAVRRVLADYPQIDADRVGVFGGSYGGYSAVMSVIRNPELFKCAASYAGVMDLTLLFTQSELNRTDYLRETLSRYVGDPEVDQAEQMEHSPVYRYRDIKRPVLLGHGMEDTIVDVEHSWRLRKMLFLAGADPEFILLDGVGHGFRYVDDARDFYEPLLAFLDTHLKTVPSEPAPSPD